MLLVGIALVGVIFGFREFMSIPLTFAISIPAIFVCGVGKGALYNPPMSMFADVVIWKKLKVIKTKQQLIAGI